MNGETVIVTNLFLFLSLVFLLTFVIGRLIERIKVPWIFAALILGFLFAIHNPFVSITSSPEFKFLARLGMYFLLFIIGFELDLNRLRRQGKFILKATFFIILFEALLGTLVIHFVFGYDWIISSIVALSFATVGEAVLIPILDEFKIVNTKLGQSIIGIGTLDDIIEIFILILVTFLVDSNTSVSRSNAFLTLTSLLILFGLTLVITEFKKKRRKFSFLDIESLFLFILFVLFLFLGVGEYAHATAIAALLSGIALKTFISKKELKIIESEVKTMCYGFFAPLFFLWVGTTMDISYLISYPLLVLLVVGVSKGTKLLGSYLVAKKELGMKKSILLGVGLSVRFSTSIIIIKILFDGGLIGTDLYSVIIASSMVFKFIVPVLFSNLLIRWKLAEIR